MAEVPEEIGKNETEAFRGVLQTSPAGGGKEFVGRGFQVEQIGDMAAGALVGGGVELEVDLVVATDEPYCQRRAVGAMREALLDPNRKAETEKGIVGRAGVKPIDGQVELGANGVGCLADCGRKRFGLDEPTGLQSGKHIHVSRGGATDESKREKRGTATNYEVLGGMTACSHDFTEQGERLFECIAAEAVHLSN